MLGHKTSLYKFKKTEIIASIFSDDNALKFKINHKKELKLTNVCRLHNIILKRTVSKKK